ncbi:MAG: type II toxin-antitoxin system VapC family toxin [Candidatus Bathyarchaeota archaeon]|nr:type II toxin-antitoxin system VapC family toxin [Candidatus Bathyarchaeota archaeon]
MDSNVFLHAILKPTRKLEPREKKIKQKARETLKRVEKGELVATSTVHISEIANIMEANTTHETAITVIQSITNLQYLTIHPVTGTHVKAAAILAQALTLGFNDTIAYLTMQENQITQIISFDRDFDKLPDVERIT